MESYSPETTLMKKKGCEKCSGTGYRGRIALHEMIVGTERMKTAIKKAIPVEEIRVIAIQDGMRTLLMDGVQKIFQGLTDLSQVLKVCASQKIDMQECSVESSKVVDIRPKEIGRMPSAHAG